MENIVYIIGAGFSAPLGVPVMSNFIEKSKDMYNTEPEKYKSFKKVFDIIKRHSMAKSYVNCDLLNIEELLSILEMEKQTRSASKNLQSYKDYLKKVIDFYTPNIKLKASLTTGKCPTSSHFFENQIQCDYAKFILTLLSCSIINYKNNFNVTNYTYEEYDPLGRDVNQIDDSILNINNIFKFNIIQNSSKYNYSIITLNYDMIIENIVTDFFCNDFNENSLNMIKLHGSIDTDIVLPTWNKSNKKLSKNWINAFNKLKNANQIRFLGYSLPKSDSYIKYFLINAISHCENLKNIDVITIDSDNETEKRYKDFFAFSKFRFVNKDLKSYFSIITPKNKKNGEEEDFTFALEDNKVITHNDFMNGKEL